MKIKDILDIAISRKASDIHFVNHLPPVLRIDGELVTLKELEINTPEIIRKHLMELANNNLKNYEKDKCLDLSFTYLETRFRLHAYKESQCDAIALRLIPKKIPTMEEINLPQIIKKFTTLESGLVLVTGTTGSGKSTTLATIINEINCTAKKHIITVENPIEFVYEHNQSIINQREVGTDVNSFSDAVIESMREDPDILLLGELRDLDTIMNAITMAETGHLVFGTLHTRSVADSVDRIIDVFPANQQSQIRIQIANSIQGIISQSLLQKIGGGRVPCCEIMFETDAIKSLIREHSNPNAIFDQIMLDSNKIGSQTMLQALSKMVIKKLITKEQALEKIGYNEKESLMKMIINLSNKG